MKYFMRVDILLRTGLAFTFIYAAIGSFINPDNWLSYFPNFLLTLLPEKLLLSTFSIYELALAAWLLSGKKTFYAAILATATLSGVVVFNLKAFETTFRDVGLIFAALALAVWAKNSKQ